MRNFINLIESLNNSSIAIQENDDVDDDDDDDDDFNLPWNKRWKNIITLPAGKVLYHGTSQKFLPNEIEGPAWFSSQKDVAKWFATQYETSRNSKVFIYKLTQNLQLPKIDNKKEFQNFKEKFWLKDYSVEDMIESMKNAGLPGWYITDNYFHQTGKPNSDDILIMNVKKYIIKK